MTKTENYNLNQWVPEDPVRRTDFNEDNAKLDAALKAQADALAAEAAARENAVAAEAQARLSIAAQVAARGNCQIVSGSYTGNGLYGADHPNSLTFPRMPLLVIIVPARPGSSCTHMIAVRGSALAHSVPAYPISICYTAWEGNKFSWYNTQGIDSQLNLNNNVYLYVAFLPADEG